MLNFLDQLLEHHLLAPVSINRCARGIADEGTSVASCNINQLLMRGIV